MYMDNKNILKEKNIFTENDYEKMMITRQYNKLYELSQDENNKKKEEYDNKKFYNLSFSQLGTNLSLTFMDMLNEFSIYMREEPENRDINNFFIIITKEGRLIYVGLILIIASIIILVISIFANCTVF